MMVLKCQCKSRQDRVQLAYRQVKMQMGYNLAFPLDDQICMMAQIYTLHFEHNVNKVAHPETRETRLKH
ncbi:hypothetical protein HanPSC8_Chr03g0119101 [Helianthus annuus]|nr:hypothetical protein HanPSC8_Chr03g0119101 [Helianthus annuus]